jgi:hypothetical protein
MQMRQEQRERAQLIHDKESGEYLKYRQLMCESKYNETWSKSAANEFGRLAQGVGGIYKGTNTIFFIHKNQVPHDRMKDVTYGDFLFFAWDAVVKMTGLLMLQRYQSQQFLRSCSLIR